MLLVMYLHFKSEPNGNQAVSNARTNLTSTVFGKPNLIIDEARLNRILLIIIMISNWPNH